MRSIRRWLARYLWLATMVGAAASLLLVSSTAAASHPVSQAITQAASSVSNPQGITAGPDGALWFTNQGNNSIGRITTSGTVTNFTGNGISGPDGITAGPDGALWFCNYNNNSIGRITTSGTVSNFTNSGIDGPQQITAGPDGNLWFTNYDNSTIGRITPSGAITIFSSKNISRPYGITAGPDGNVWFTNYGNNSIGRITTNGTVTDFAKRTLGGIRGPYAIAAGPDGNLWFTVNFDTNAIGRITTSGQITLFKGKNLKYADALTAGPDGNMWFTNGNNAIAKITPAGHITSFARQGVATSPPPDGIAAGPDGALWFTNYYSNSIGRITTSGVVTIYTGNGISHTGTSLAVQSRVSAPALSGSPSGVTGGALFGGNYPVVPLESSLGRQLAIVRLYYFIGDSFPGPTKYQNLMSGGRTLMISLDSKDTSYASIAAGNEDTAITNFLTAVNQAAIKYNLGSIYVTFEHEADNESHRALGAPVQFLQAWDHIYQLAASANLDWNNGGRLHWVLTLIHNTYGSWRESEFWPGNSEVDLIAADGYNSAGCGSGGQGQQQTPADTFGPLLSFAASHGNLPVFLAEWGSDDIPSGEQATYINQMQSYVASNSAIVGAMYWDTHVGNCNYKVDGNSTSISALATMGQSTALQGQV